MTAVDIFGPANAPNAVTSRPDDDRSFATNDTWFKDCSSSTANDGTKVKAGWINSLIANLRTLTRANGQTAGSVDVVNYNNTDDMLLRSIQQLSQRNQAKYVVAGGTANAITASLSPAPAELKEGMFILLKMASAPLGAATLTLNDVPGAGPKPMVRRGGAPISAADWNAGDMLLWEYTGTNWMAGSFLQSDIPGGIPLQANADWYVNNATGSDTLYDGTSATVSGIHGPFKTIQRADAQCQKFNMNGFDQTIHVADGTYTGPVLLHPTNGSGTCHLVGNESNPQNCPITSTAGAGGCAILQIGGTWDIRGFRLSQTTGANGLDGASCNAGKMTLSNMRFGPCQRYQISAVRSGSVFFGAASNIIIESGANAVTHIDASLGGQVAYDTINGGPNLTILGPVTFSAFVNADFAGTAQVTYASITGAGNVTGSKYVAALNGIVSSSGGGASYYPGTIAGTTITGGQYN